MPISPDLLKLGEPYTRIQLSKLFDQPNLATSREGPYVRDGQSYGIYFVTLDKTHADPSVAYNDYFENGLFFWESQNRNTIDSKIIRSLLSVEYTLLLFVREAAKVNSRTQPFYYAGRLMQPVHDPNSSRPVKIAFEPVDLADNTPRSLQSLIAWKPSAARREMPTGEFANWIAEKKRAASSRSQGYESDARIRSAIERRAMQFATQAYVRRDYEVKNVSATQPYDLYCTKEAMCPRRVEVKGTRGSPEFVILTSGEVAAAREESATTDLFIVHGIQVDFVDGQPVATEGTMYMIQNWRPDDSDLTPTQYRYRVPIGK